MKKLGQISIALFVLNNTLFDLFAIPKSTKLNVLFFSFMYLSLLLICVNEFIGSKLTDKFSFVMGIGFTIRIIIELFKWNYTWEQYEVSVTNYEQGLLFTFLTIALLLSISHARKH